MLIKITNIFKVSLTEGRKRPYYYWCDGHTPGENLLYKSHKCRRTDVKTMRILNRYKCSLSGEIVNVISLNASRLLTCVTKSKTSQQHELAVIDIMFSTKLLARLKSNR
jgi:hypothetical protein